MFELKLLIGLTLVFVIRSESESHIQCPSNWTEHQGKCLSIKLAKYSFTGANQSCSSENGVLASFRSEAEAKSLFEEVHTKKLLYIGTWIPSKVQNGEYVNLDGSQGTWLNIQPKNTNSSRDVPRQWGPCIVARAFWHKDTGVRVEEFPIPCETIVDGFVCQLNTTSAMLMDQKSSSEPSPQNAHSTNGLPHIMSQISIAAIIFHILINL